jgi:hypothetical protein
MASRKNIFNSLTFLYFTEMASDDEQSPHVIKLRGLPYEVSKAQIITFLKDVNIQGKENFHFHVQEVQAML